MNDASGPVLVVPEPTAEEIFVVDDDRPTLKVLSRVIRLAGYETRSFDHPEAALREVRSGHPKVLVTDNDMPGMLGLELAEKASQVNPDLRVILVTGAGSETTAQAALRLGSLDYLTKPVDAGELTRAVQRAFMAHAVDEYTQAMDGWLRGEVRQQTELVREVTLGALETLVHALEARSPHFARHSHRVAECAEGVARALDLSPATVAAVRSAGLLHDIGMIGVPDAIVNKPDALDPAETREIKGHCGKGAAILEPMTHLGPAVTFVLEHHERWDGSGYPDSKEGHEISIGGQAVGVAEAWVAITERRTYRDGMAPAEAMETLSAAAGEWFAPELVDALRVWRRGSAS